MGLGGRTRSTAVWALQSFVFRIRLLLHAVYIRPPIHMTRPVRFCQENRLNDLGLATKCAASSGFGTFREAAFLACENARAAISESHPVFTRAVTCELPTRPAARPREPWRDGARRPGALAARGGSGLRPRGSMVGATGFEPATSSSRTKRATNLRHAPTLLIANLNAAGLCPLKETGQVPPRGTRRRLD